MENYDREEHIQSLTEAIEKRKGDPFHYLSDHILALIVEKDGKPIAYVLDNKVVRTKGVEVSCVYNYEYARKHLKDYLPEIKGLDLDDLEG